MSANLKEFATFKDDTTRKIEEKVLIITRLTGEINMKREEASVLKSQDEESGLKFQNMLDIAIDEKQRAEVDVEEKQSELNELRVHKAKVDDWKSNAEETMSANLKEFATFKDDTTRKIEEKVLIITRLTGEINMKREEASVLKSQDEESGLKFQNMLDIAIDEKQRAEVVVEEKQSELNELRVNKARADELQDQLLSEQSSETMYVSNKFESTIKALEKDARAKKEENIKLHAKYASTSAELASAQEQLESTQLSLENLASQVEERDDVIRAKTAEISDLQEQLVSDEASGSESRRQLEATLHDKEDEVGRLKMEFKRASEDASAMQAQLNESVNSASLELCQLKKWKVNVEEHLETVATETRSLQEQLLAEKTSNAEVVKQLEATVRAKKSELNQSQLDLQRHKREETDLRAKLNAETLAKDTVVSELALLEHWKLNAEASLRRSSEEVASTTRQLTDALEIKAQQFSTLQQTQASEMEEANVKYTQIQNELERAICDLDKNVEKYDEQVALLEECDIACDAFEEEIAKLKDELLREQESKSEDASNFQIVLQTKEEANAKKITNLQRKLKESRIEYDREIKAAGDSIAKKSEEASTLAADVKHLELELRDAKEIFNKKLVEERVSKHDYNRALQTALDGKEKELSQLRNDLQEAAVAARKMQAEIDSQILMVETSHIESERATAGIVELQEQVKAAKDSVGEKTEEVSTLSASVELCNKNLIEERERRLDETRRMKTALSAKEKEVVQIKDDLKVSVTGARKIQAELDAASLMAEPMTVEISDLRALKRDAVKAMEENNNELKAMKSKISSLNRQCEEKQEMIIDKETEISFLHGECEQHEQTIEELETKLELAHKLKAFIDQKLSTADYDAASRFEQKLLVLSKEKDLLKMDATSKLQVISDLISKNNEILQEIETLSLWKEDAERRMKISEQEKIASDILAQRIVDLESALESDILAQHIVDLESALEHQRSKYLKAMKALAGMEQALLAVEKQRKKLVQTKPFPEELTIEPWGCMEEETSLDGNTS